MQYLKFVSAAFGAIATFLCFNYGLHNFGGQGWLTIGLSAAPIALAGLGIMQKGMPRWASVVSALSFLIVAMKTTQGESLQNIMMAAAGGLIVAIVMAIKPDKT